MNTEQEHTDFEAWCHTRSLDIGRDDKGDYISLETYLSWEGYQAGRAALQSQDREDAERYRHLRDKGELMPRDIFNTWWLADHGNPQTLDAAIDRARRVEGEGE